MNKFNYKNNNNSTQLLKNEEPCLPMLPPLDVFENCNKFNIKTIGASIYFYEEINSNTILALKENIEDLSAKILEESYKLQFDPVIHLHIYSPGGDAFMGLSIYDYIKNHKVKIWTYIDGMIASAATFIYLAGHRRFVSQTSMMLIHQISTYFGGKYEELKDEYENSSNMMTIIKNIYKANTQMPKKTIDSILKRELLLTANDCIKYNIADEMI
tara:strand:+ start:829 stop:1470 length:642 start_codon:yes stop_codon:yes gene_type:complete